ncbi:MAG: histidine phosphatase family protein, partial [Deltaproteobacteria bacterium]|nr:histidine phosphatase family protein [Deltaproteobacteria bacterium]
RHGQTDWNVNKTVMGRLPIPLNAMGRGQAEKLAERLNGITVQAIFTSPVLRALETAEILAKSWNGIEVVHDEGLAEIDYGEWVKQSFKLVHEKYADIWKNYCETPDCAQFPGGESLFTARARVAAVVDRVVKEYDNGFVALVSHADIVKLALLHIFKLPLSFLHSFSIDNCASLIIRYDPVMGPRLVCSNHLNGFGKDL